MNGQTVQKLVLTLFAVLGACVLFSAVAEAQAGADHAMLLAGKKLSFPEDNNGQAPAHELPAQWLEEAADKGQTIDIHNAKIVGDLELTDRTIQKGVRCTKCEFTGEVNFRRSIVERPLDLTDSTFDDEVLMDDSDFRSIVQLDDVNLQHAFNAKSAYFHREFLARRATFGAEFNLDSSKLDGSCDFTGSTFERTSFQRTDFGSDALFRSTLFQEIAGFESAIFEGNARFDSGPNQNITVFDNNADFTWAHFAGFADFSGVTFASDVSFNSARMDRLARFNSDPDGAITLFKGIADFGSAHFADAEFSGVRFRGRSYFTSSTFAEDANFNTTDASRPTEFGDTTDFGATEFLRDANFSNVVFAKNAQFTRVKVLGRAQFDSTLSGNEAPLTEFKGIVDFVIADFEGQASFCSTRFDGRASFRGAKFNAGAFFEPDENTKLPTVFLASAEFRRAAFFGRAMFTNVIFERRVYFTTADIDALADFSGTDFKGAVDFDSCRFTSLADFESTRFDGGVSFHDSTFQTVRFASENGSPAIAMSPNPASGLPRGGAITDSLAYRWVSSFFAKNPTQFPKRVDFQGANYERIENWKSPISRLSKFSPEPYVAVETFLRRSGYDADADNVVLARKARERKALFHERKIFRWLLSWLDKILFNYGVHPYRLAILFGLFILLGSLFFSLPDTVLLTGKNEGEVKGPSPQLSGGQAFAFIVSQCLPVETPMTTQWRASDQPVELRLRVGKSRSIGFSIQPSVVAFSLKVLGWLFVPIGLAALTNLL
jgi:hypothetical protein